MIMLTVKGMHCKSCKMIVHDTLEELGAKSIVIDMNEKKQIGKVSFDNLERRKRLRRLRRRGMNL